MKAQGIWWLRPVLVNTTREQYKKDHKGYGILIKSSEQIWLVEKDKDMDLILQLQALFLWDCNAGLNFTPENLTDLDKAALESIITASTPCTDEDILLYFNTEEQDVFPGNGYELHYSWENANVKDHFFTDN
jgi:hypothetical protein